MCTYTGTDMIWVLLPSTHARFLSLPAGAAGMTHVWTPQMNDDPQSPWLSLPSVAQAAVDAAEDEVGVDVNAFD